MVSTSARPFAPAACLLCIGSFIVDDDGQGYMDIGEEDDHWNARGDRYEKIQDTAQHPVGEESRSPDGAGGGSMHEYDCVHTGAVRRVTRRARRRKQVESQGASARATRAKVRGTGRQRAVLQPRASAWHRIKSGPRLPSPSRSPAPYA